MRLDLTTMLSKIADAWIARATSPDPVALSEVAGLSPAVVVTGASRGIGFELARQYAQDGMAVVLIARGQVDLSAAAEKIRARASQPVIAVSVDVTAQDAISRIDNALRSHALFAHVVVNNAGLGISGPFAGNDHDELDRLVALNVAALTRMMHHYLQAMLSRGSGGIINLASLGGLAPGPYQAAYYASKAYVISLTRAVAVETSGRGVRIAAVAPGPVETQFHSDMDADFALYRYLIPPLSAARVARSIRFWFPLGRRLIVPGVINSILALALGILPQAISAHLVAWLLTSTRSGTSQR